MEPIHRLSMNTSLKNARIFDDDAWDDDDCPRIKKEIKQEPKESVNAGTSQFSKVKQEFNYGSDEFDDCDDTFEEECDNTCDKDKLANSFCHKSIKQIVTNLSPPSSKSTLTHEHNMEEGELGDSICKTQYESSLNTSPGKIKCEFSPPSPTILSDLDAAVDKFDESPYNKELFRYFKIQELTPVKIDNPDLNSSNSGITLKSAKRTVFSRSSPYKVDSNTYGKRISAKSRLGPKEDSEEEDEDCMPRPRKCMKPDLESDPAVIARREKQIEYGKNTVAYENYLKLIPRSDRKRKDPQTPPLFGKYSRRGWEGLIKQWRIKLHRFDPPDCGS